MKITGYESENGNVTAITVTDETRGFYDKRFIEDRPHGEWITTSNIWADDVLNAWGHYKECSCCHNQERRRTPFCPNCGADLRKEGEAE